MGDRSHLLVVAVAVAAACAPRPAQGQPEPFWVKQFGTGDTDYALALAPDGAAGVFLAGYTNGSLGGPNAGMQDGLVARFDAAGVPTWISQFGSADNDRAYAVAPDGVGGIFVAGLTSGDLGGVNMGGWDVFLARFNAEGAMIWFRQFGTSDDDAALGLAPDGAGGVFIAGITSGSLASPNAGARDCFVARFDGAGVMAWAVQIGTSGDDEVSSAASDGTGGVYIAGLTHGSLGGPNAGGRDAFVARFLGGGEQAWIVQFGTESLDMAGAIASEGAGVVFVAGTTEGSLGGPRLGSVDAFVGCFGSAGDQQWLVQFGTPYGEFADALAPDGMGGVVVAGSSGGDLGGPNAGARDAFLARFGRAGNQTWAASLGTAEYEQALALAPIRASGVVVAGYTTGSLGGANAGYEDAFLARYGAACGADCDWSRALDLFDFLCFINQFGAADGAADCEGDGVLDLYDFLCFVNAFNAGC